MGLYLTFFVSLCRYDTHHREVRIVLVGKYTKSQDSYLSLIKSLKHAALACRYKLVLLVSVVAVVKYCLIKNLCCV